MLGIADAIDVDCDSEAHPFRLLKKSMGNLSHPPMLDGAKVLNSD
jgi:hypothetical protein